MMNFTSLTAAKTVSGSIKRWVNWSEIDAEVVLEEAQALIYSMLRVREMRSMATLALAVGDSTKALPTGYLDPIGDWIGDTANNRYRQVTESRLAQLRSYDAAVLTSGQPGRWAIFDELIQFDCKFDAAASINFLHYKTPTVLSAGNLTNFLTTRYPIMLRKACLAMAEDFRSNEAAASRHSETLFSLIAAANAESDLGYRGADIDTE